MVVKEWLTDNSASSSAIRVVDWTSETDRQPATKRYPWEGFYEVGFRTVMDISGDF